MAQYFNLTLDTIAPSGGSVSGLAYYKMTGSVSVNAGPSGASYMKVWTSQSATGTTSDTNYPSSWSAYATNKIVVFSGEGTNYIHAQFMDEVGNISSIVDSAAVIYDTAAPTISAVSINSEADYTNSTSVTVRVTVSDATSGVDYVTLGGNITETGNNAKFTFNNTDRTNGYKDCTVTLASTDGSKTISATATDLAGNTSSASSDTITLDTAAASATFVIRTKGDTANLPTYVNDDDFAVAIFTEDANIVSYKIWGGVDGATTEPATWTAIQSTDWATSGNTKRLLVDNLEFTSGEGSKIINVEIRDIAGNVTILTPQTIIVDTTAPVVTLTSDVSIISAQTGYNTVVFTCGASDTNSAQGLSYELKCNGTTIKSGSTFTSSISVTESEIVAISAGDGYKSFVLYVTDIAGNTGESSAVHIEVDTTAPSIGIQATDSSTGTVTAYIFNTTSQTSTPFVPINGIKIWYDDGTEPSEWATYNSSAISIINVPEGVHTFHAKAKDNVNNISSTVDAIYPIIVDWTAPTGTISTASYTNSRNITVNLTIADATLDFAQANNNTELYPVYMKVWENGTTEPSEWEDYASTKSLTLTTGDGSKTINVKFKDSLGNESSIVAATCSTVLDTDEPDVTLALVKTDNTTTLPAHVNLRGFNARIGFTNEIQDSPIISYKLTGDFTGSSDSWQTFTADSGKSYMTISNLQFTTGDGTKTITALLKDEEGNVSATGASVTVTYDSSAAVIDVAAPDYNIVSKQHTLRLNASGATIAGKYNDTCIFTWSSNEALQAFKVCVNEVNQTAAGATAIGTTHGSQNMSGTSVAANTDITSVIIGSDFAATSAVDDTDGAYEIIVYGQDLAGSWSAVHQLS